VIENEGDNSGDERGEKIKDGQEAKILQEESTAEEVVSCGHIITCGPSSVSGFKQR